MPDQELKQKIHALLSSQMKEGEPMHLARAAALLNENGIECRANGYKKMRLLLEDLDFLEVKDVSIDGKPHAEVFLKAMPCAKRKGAALDCEQLKQLYGLFCRLFEKGTPYHMATVSKTIMDAGVDRTRFGFGKTKTFFKALDAFLTLKEVRMSGVPQVVVTLRDVPDWNGVTETDRIIFKEEQPAKERILPADVPLMAAEKEPAKEKTAEKQPKTEKPAKKKPARESKESARKEESRLPGLPLSHFADMPSQTIAHLRSFCNIGIQPDSYICSCIDEGYEQALREKTLRIQGDRILFATPLRDQDGAVVQASVRPSSIEGGLPWFLNYLGSVGEETPSEEPGRMLERFADLGDWPLFLGQLAQTALPEDWSFGGSEYGVLRQYIQYTFYRLQLEDKVLISDDDTLAAFNTGLVDKHYDDLYACFIPSGKKNAPEWQFASFCTAASRGIGKRLVETFSPLPQPPSYFERKEDLLFDLEKDLHVDFYHIIIDNIHRLPLNFLREECASSAPAVRIIGRLQKARPHERGDLYEKLRDLIDENERLFNRIRSRIEDAIDLACKQVRWNFRVAVPCFFPTRNAMSLMLPLDLDYDDQADTALVVELMRSGNYQGQTILTLRQAYIDARLICRPAGGDWLRLNPQSAPDEEE